MDDARHERVGIAAQVRTVYGHAQHLGHLSALQGAGVLDQRRGHVVGAKQRPVGDERPRVGVADLDRDVAEPLPALRQ